MFGRDFVTARTESDFFSAVLFEFIRNHAAKTSNDETFAIVHSEPEGERERHVTKFASAEALAAFEACWLEALGRRRIVRTLAA